MPTQAPRPTPDVFLAPYPPTIQAIAHRLRDLVKQTLPGVSEAVYPGWGLIGYRLVEGKRSVYLGYIHPTDERVALGFEQGVYLPNPDGLLEGNGKQVRYVTFREPGDIQTERLARLLREAAEVTWMPKELRVKQK